MDTTVALGITVMIVLLIIILFVAVYLGGKRIDSTRKLEIIKRLEELELSVGSLEASVRRDAIVKVDNILSTLFQIKYNNKATCGDNLKRAKNLFPKKEYENLWKAHKIRNNIVHSDYEIEQDEAENVYSIYKSSITKILK